VDHTHADATNMICAAENGEELARECFGDEAIWIPYIRPGFTLAKQVGEAMRSDPGAKLVLLAKHGLVTWGDSSEESYDNTITTINRAAEFVAEKSAGKEPFGGRRMAPVSSEKREELLAAVLPALRGAVSGTSPKILRADTSEDVMEFVCGEDSRELSQVGAACPDHLVQTKVRPLWVEFDPENEGAAELKEKLISGVERYRQEYEAYFSRHEEVDEEMHDPNPRVVLVSGVGLISVGTDYKSATLERDFYHRAIAVMRGASTIDTFISLNEEESYAVEYWPLELYKLTLKPPPEELEGKVALVTGGAGGIGSAVARTLAAKGACVAVADLDADGASEVADSLDNPGQAVHLDATSEEAVAAAYREAVLAYGGIDVVVSNAGLASGAPIEETSVELWERDHAVLARGYFLVAREAFRVLREQGAGGSIVFVASKNALVAGKNASAYSVAKAAELHLARCLAEEGGEDGIRVNTVNPDAVLQGSKIWDSSWREERAQSYGIAPDELEEHYRQRTTLKVNVFPEDVAEAVLFFASPVRSLKSTGNVLNVDGGVKEAYPR
jgi:rhamnulose-1-phosphate aldolase/alcohol dehydrogenase